MKSNSIVITFEIGAPDKKGIRPILASAGRANELPLIATGTFAERHALLDNLWMQLAKREPLIVDSDSKSEPTAADIAQVTADLDTTANDDPGRGCDGDDEPAAQESAPALNAYEETVARLEAQPVPPPPRGVELDQLPIIAGDPTI